MVRRCSSASVVHLLIWHPKNHDGPPLRDARTIILSLSEQLWHQHNVLLPDHAEDTCTLPSGIVRGSKTQLRRNWPSNSPLMLSSLVWFKECGTGQFCLNIFGQAKLSLVDGRQSRSISILRHAAGMFLVLKTVLTVLKT